MNDSYINTLSVDYLISIFEEHLAVKNTVGVDGVSVECFASNLAKETEIIHRKVSNQSYDFSLYKEKLILKDRYSCPRVIAIPTVRDKVVVKALHKYLNEMLNVDVSISSAHTHIKSIKKMLVDEKHLNGFIRIDIKNFFPSIDHQVLMNKLKKNLNSDCALKLIKKCISQTTVSRNDKNREKYQNKQGIPQGLAISGLLADFYLQGIDKKFQQNAQIKYYRFVDDILILCRKEEIKAIRSDLIQQINKLGLTTHKECHNSQKSSSGAIVDGIDYLGYVFKGNKISVRKSSVEKLYSRLGRIFAIYTTDEEQGLEQLYYKVNLAISGCFFDEKQIGWLCYFKYINNITLLYQLDKYVAKLFKRFNVPLRKNKLKRFVRSYWEVQKGMESKYLPKFNKDKLPFDSIDLDLQKPKRLGVKSSKQKIKNVQNNVILLEDYRQKNNSKLEMKYLKELMEVLGDVQPYYH